MKRALVLGIAILCAVGFPTAVWLVFFETPVIDSPELYFNQKIFYFHVPNSIMLFVAVFVCGIYSVRFLRGRNPEHDDVANAAAQAGVLFGTVMLVTGSIWAKAAWNKWWVWEARLMIALLLWMTMLAYVLVRRYGGPGSERLGAGLGAFAMINVPLVYMAVHIWRTQHPKTSVVPGLSGKMLLTFWLSMLMFLGLLVLTTKLYSAMGRASRKLEEAREHALDAGLL